MLNIKKYLMLFVLIGSSPLFGILPNFFNAAPSINSFQALAFLPEQPNINKPLILTLLKSGNGWKLMKYSWPAETKDKTAGLRLYIPAFYPSPCPADWLGITPENDLYYRNANKQYLYEMKPSIAEEILKESGCKYFMQKKSLTDRTSTSVLGVFPMYNPDIWSESETSIYVDVVRVSRNGNWALFSNYRKKDSNYNKDSLREIGTELFIAKIIGKETKGNVTLLKLDPQAAPKDGAPYAQLAEGYDNSVFVLTSKNQILRLDQDGKGYHWFDMLKLPYPPNVKGKPNEIFLEAVNKDMLYVTTGQYTWLYDKNKNRWNDLPNHQLRHLVADQKGMIAAAIDKDGNLIINGIYK